MNIKGFLKNNKKTIFIVAVIIVLISLVIYYSTKNKEGFYVGPNWPNMKLINYSNFVNKVNVNNVWGTDSFKNGNLQLMYSTDFSSDTFSPTDKSTTWNIRNDLGNPSFKQVLSARVPENFQHNSDGSVTLLSKFNTGKTDPYKYHTAGIRSNKKLQYGYYEAVYKYANSPDIDNAFWLTTPDPDVYEIDINEGFSPKKNTGTLHHWSPTHKTLSYFEGHDGEYDKHNTYGFLYTPNVLAWYVNGNLVHKVDNSKIGINYPVTVWFTTAVFDHGNINNSTIGYKGMNVKSFKYYT